MNFLFYGFVGYEVQTPQVNSEIPFCGPNATAKRVTCPHDKRIRSLYHCGSCLDPICAKHQFILCHQCYRLNHTHITENKPQK